MRMIETSKSEHLCFCNKLKGSANMSQVSMMFATIFMTCFNKNHHNELTNKTSTQLDESVRSNICLITSIYLNEHLQ